MAGRGTNKLPATVEHGSRAHRFYAAIPKHVLFDCAIYLAAQVSGNADDLTTGAVRLLEEWVTLHSNGIVSTKPVLR